ncbi:MAG TPA: hypothetical protein VFD58_33005 [Blastocatellia bacterium]|nr:hypothetical protein [Blastocatellia bacterium]
MATDGTFSTGRIQVFQCPSCQEYINTSTNQCRYCGMLIDAALAQASAQNQAGASRACSDANYLKIMTRTMPVFFLISLIPVIGGFAGWGFIFLLIAVPILIVRWWVRYGGIQTQDADYPKARNSTFISLAIWLAMVIVWIVSTLLWAVIFAVLSN